MYNWFCYQMAMYYLWRAKRVPAMDIPTWAKFISKSMKWITKIIV